MNHIRYIISAAILALTAMPVRADTISVMCHTGTISDYVQVNMQNFEPGVSLIVSTSGISGTYDVQVSNDARVSQFDELRKFQLPQAMKVTNWVAHDVLTGFSTDAISNAVVPVQWFRVNCSNISAGTVTLSVGQKSAK